MSKSKLFIIGGNGVLGSDLVSSLGLLYEVESINRENYGSYIGKTCDILINANGNSKRFWANKNILADFKSSTLSVYNTLVDFKFSKYIYVSSSDVYHDHTNPTYAKENNNVNSDILSPYGLHKYLSECILKNFAKDYVILRSSLILGNKIVKGPIYDILNKKTLFISLDSEIQMITTSEIANIIKMIIDKNIKNELINMGGIGTVNFNMIEKLTGLKPTVSAGAERQRYEMNIEKLSKIYPVKKSIEYLTEYINNVNI